MRDEYYTRIQCLLQLYRLDLFQHNKITNRVNHLKIAFQIIIGFFIITLYLSSVHFNIEILFALFTFFFGGIDGYMVKRERKFDREGRIKSIEKLERMKILIEKDENIDMNEIREQYLTIETSRIQFSSSVIKKKIQDWKDKKIRYIPSFLQIEEIHSLSNNEEYEKRISIASDLLNNPLDNPVE